ncbi:MAG: hypothetical protein ABIX37_10785 [Gammaproteobacteria bacterium]
MKTPKRASFNEVATRGEEPPPPPSHSCTAHGCPLAGSIKINGSAFCFVHLDMLDTPMQWGGATARIRNRMPYVSAIEVLRAPGLRTDAMALDQAREYVPNLGQEHDTRYKAMVAIESRLITLAKHGEEPAGEPVPALNAVTDAAQRFAQSHRMPGA